MNILITGASGFVGRALTKKLSETNNTVFVVSRDSTYKPEKATVFYGDITDKQVCEKILLGIDVVYYLAAYKKNVAIHTQKSFDSLYGNVLPFLQFLNTAKNFDIKKIVYVSSTNAGYALSPESVDGYAIGKYINELIAKSYVSQTKHGITVVRSVGVYGPGDNFDTETANFIPSTIMKVYTSESEISVWGSGKREMQFIYVDDVVSNLIAAAESDTDFLVIGNKEVLTVNDVVHKVISTSGKHIIIKNDTTKEDKPSQLFDFTNIVEPKTSFDEGLSKTVEWYKKIYE